MVFNFKCGLVQRLIKIVTQISYTNPHNICCLIHVLQKRKSNCRSNLYPEDIHNKMMEYRTDFFRIS